MAGAPIPVLRSFDEARTRAFYLDFLGFELLFEHRFEPDLPLYLAIGKGACELHLSEHYGDACPGAALRIPVEDVSGWMAELRAKAFGNARPGEPQPTPWGTREIRMHDPAGNVLIFYTEMEEAEGGA